MEQQFAPDIETTPDDGLSPHAVEDEQYESAEAREPLDELDAELEQLVAEIEAARSVEEVDQLEAAGKERLLTKLYERGEQIAFLYLRANNRLLQVGKWPQPVRAALLMDPPIETYGDFLVRRANQPPLFRRLMIAKDVLVGTVATAWTGYMSAYVRALENFTTQVKNLGPQTSEVTDNN